MLAKILEDMWIEPEVLEALSEDQKRILFHKMREEQVRRWRVREETEEKERRDNQDDNNGPKKVCNKNVRWLLGRDGDVCVRVIGEVDEFRSSKLLQSLMNNSNRERADSVNVTQTEREAPQTDYKEDIQLSLADVTDDPASQSGLSSEEEVDQEAEDSDSESGESSDNHGEWAPLYRPHLSCHGNPPTPSSLLVTQSDTERPTQQDTETVSHEEKNLRPLNRVAQLRKAFNDDPRTKTPASTKPPLPVKPAHLQTRATPLVH